MDDELLETDALSRKSLLPGAGFFYPDSLDEERAERRAREAVDGAEVVVVTDSDADGLGCLALLREANDATLDPGPFEAAVEARLEDGDERGVEYDDGRGDHDAEEVDTEEVGAEEVDAHEADHVTDTGEGVVASEGEDSNPVEPGALPDDDPDAAADDLPTSRVALLASGPRTLAEDLARAAKYVEPGADLVVCDLCPDSYRSIAPALEALTERCASVRWFDHHQWESEVARRVRELGVELVVGESEEECTVDVVLRSLEYEFPERFRELAAVTRDHDLWIKEDPRSDDLSDYAAWSDPEEYATVVGNYGVDLPAPVTAYVAQRRIEKENLIERAVERAELKRVGPWTVGVTYGRCSQNEVAEALRRQGADAAVVVKPAGSASIRGSEGFERCHEVARQVQGGGHPKAAGCKPDVYDDMLDYAHHWSTQGSATKRVILAAFERLAADGDDATDGDADGPDADQ